ncbi:hypothetical protein ACOUKA_13180 [Acinetobacter baumannii]
MPFKFDQTDAQTCGKVLDAPVDADVEMTKTKAVDVKTVFYIRDNEENLKQKILDSVVDGTPTEVIQKFIQSIKELESVKTESIVDITYKTGLSAFLKSEIVGVVGFASSIIGIISPFLP